MNIYLLAFISVIVAFAVGFVVYGVIFKKPLGTADEKMDPSHLVQVTILVYLAMLAFIYLFDNVSFGEDVSAVGSGMLLGLICGLGIFAFPMIADSGFFKTKAIAVQAVAINWAFSFMVVGAIVGWLR